MHREKGAGYRFLAGWRSAADRRGPGQFCYAIWTLYRFALALRVGNFFKRFRKGGAYMSDSHDARLWL